jgi:hypothetical protein
MIARTERSTLAAAKDLADFQNFPDERVACEHARRGLMHRHVVHRVRYESTNRLPRSTC